MGRQLGCVVTKAELEKELDGRDGQIRTADPSHPKRVLYQAEPRPDTVEPARVSRPLGVLI